MPLGSLETQVMAVMWAAGGPLTVREALDALNARRGEPLAYTTVLTVMSRLADKGALARAERGRGHLYAPAVADEAALAVQDVIQAYGNAALSQFVDQASADPALRARLQELMSEEPRSRYPSP